MPILWPMSAVPAALLALSLSSGDSDGELNPPAPAAADAAVLEPLVLPAGEHKLVDVTDMIGSYLKLNILTESLEAGPKEVKFKQDLRLEGDQALDVLSQLLLANNCALTTLDEKAMLLEVITLNSSGRQTLLRRAAFASPEEIFARPRLGMWVTTTVKLQHIDAQAATNSLRPFFSGSGGSLSVMFGSVGNRDSLLIGGFQNNVAGMLTLLASMDVPESAAKIREVEKLRSKVKSLEARIKKLEAKD